MSISSLNVSQIVRSVSDLFNDSLILTDEEDKWFERTYKHLNEVQWIISQLQHDVEHLSHSRKGQAKSSIDLNRSISALALHEDNAVLSLTLDKLADFHASSSSLQNYDAEMDYLLVRSFVDQISVLKHFKDRIIGRSKAWKDMNDKEILLKRKREIKIQNYLIGKLDRLDQEKKHINELEKHIATLSEDLGRKDDKLRTDYEGFSKVRLSDLKATFIKWLSLLEETEQKTLENWQDLKKNMDQLTV